ncbi:MAG: tRNA pseudouridine(38-40) synthase TruA [Clostridia bacterium]|nr:tRNA pseudouridine(38-40) synthase TruA [Clostridia bacterium]
MRIKLTVSYDGTDFSGWQRQTDKTTVQQTIEDAIFSLTGEKVKVVGSGRTDAGVHALGQVAHFDTKSTIPPSNFAKALNTILPLSVKVLKSEEVAKSFDASRTAKRKTYCYSLYKSDVILPLKERYSVMIKKDTDVKIMKDVAKLFVGEHDFKSFCASGSSVKTTVRTVYSVEIKEEGEDVKVYITGNGFLYNMVRIIVGTLVECGQKRIDEKAIKTMLNEKRRNIGGRTLSAKGLCLVSVEY